MAQEIECKIMGMTLQQFLDLAREKRLEFVFQRAVEVTDVYWENTDGEVIRCRHGCSKLDSSVGKFMVANEYIDLTVKGCEENDGNKISEREEIVLPQVKSLKEVNAFLSRIGFHINRTLLKERNVFIDANDQSPIRIHHDKFFLSGDYEGPAVEWVEVEADTKGYLYEFLFQMGIEWEDISNKSTLDIINEYSAHQE